MASSDLVNMGISVVSYTLKDVHDDQVGIFCPIRVKQNGWIDLRRDVSFLTKKNVIFYILTSSCFPLYLKQDYLHSLGKGRTAQVQKDARIGEAQNKRDAVIRVR